MSQHYIALRTSIIHSSSRQWQYELQRNIFENILKVCEDVQLLSNLSPFKAFLFARHLVNKKNNDNSVTLLSRFITNAPQLQKYIHTIESDGLFFKHLKSLFVTLLHAKRVKEASLIFHACNTSCQENLLAYCLSLPFQSFLTTVKDSAFFRDVDTHLPIIIIKNLLKLSNSLNLCEIHSPQSNILTTLEKTEHIQYISDYFLLEIHNVRLLGQSFHGEIFGLLLFSLVGQADQAYIKTLEIQSTIGISFLDQLLKSKLYHWVDPISPSVYQFLNKSDQQLNNFNDLLSYTQVQTQRKQLASYIEEDVSIENKDRERRRI